MLIEGTNPDALRAAAQDALGAQIAELAAPTTTPVFETWRFLYGNERLSDAETV